MKLKKFLAVLTASLFLWFTTAPAFAANGTTQPIIATGTLTQANARISGVNGTAFISSDDDTLSAALTAAVTHNDWIEIMDSSKRKIGGFVRAKGTGETLSDERVTGFTNYASSLYATFTTSGVDISQAVRTTTGARCYSNALGNSAGQLLLLARTYAKASGTNPYFILGSTVSLGGVYTTLTVGNSNYTTVKDDAQDYFGYQADADVDFSATGNSIKKVLTPSDHGCTVANTPSGSGTQNWAIKDANFNYNDSSGYTWVVKSSTKWGQVISSNVDYTSDFSAGLDGWLGSGGIGAGNIDSIGGENDWYRYTAGTENTTHGNYRTPSTTLIVGDRYTISYKYYIPSGQSNIDGLRLFDGAGNITYDSLQTTTDTVTTRTVTFTAVSANGIRFYFYDGAVNSWQDVGGDDVAYLKSIIITHLNSATTVASGTLHIATVAGAGKMFHDSVDLSSYAGASPTPKYRGTAYAGTALVADGYFGPVGGGEALGADLLNAWDLTSGWSTVGTGSITDNNTFATTGSGGVKKEGLFTLGTIYKLAGVTSQATMQWVNGGTSTGHLIGTGSGTYYFTAANVDGLPTALYLRNPAALTTDITSQTVSALTDIPATGVTALAADKTTASWITSTPSNAADKLKVVRAH